MELPETCGCGEIRRISIVEIRMIQASGGIFNEVDVNAAIAWFGCARLISMRCTLNQVLRRRTYRYLCMYETLEIRIFEPIVFRTWKLARAYCECSRWDGQRATRTARIIVRLPSTLRH